MEKEQLVLLVTSAQKGDSNATNELFNAFYNDLYYFALKTVKDDDLALDITQEAFVEIINTLGNLKEPAAFVTWAKQITYHQCTRYFKKKKDVLVDEDEEGHTVFDTLKEENTEFIPDESLDRDDFKKTILSILDELSEEQRSAVMMYYFDEMSVCQIAEIQGVSQGTVKSRLNYARKAIKESVEEYEKKNGIKLHAIPFIPFFKWIFDGSFGKGISATAAQAMAKGVTAATGITITATTATAATTTVAATTAATTATGIGAKIAAIPLAVKIIAGTLAASIVIGGATTAVVVNNNNKKDDDNSKKPAINQSELSEELEPPSKEEIILGEYKGSYNPTHGETGLTLLVYKDGDQTKAIFNFYNLPDKTNAKNGAYYMDVVYDAETDQYKFTAIDWILHPRDYNFVNLVGKLEDDILSGSESVDFSLTKTNRKKSAEDFVEEILAPMAKLALLEGEYEGYYVDSYMKEKNDEYDSTPVKVTVMQYYEKYLAVFAFHDLPSLVNPSGKYCYVILYDEATKEYVFTEASDMEYANAGAYLQKPILYYTPEFRGKLSGDVLSGEAPTKFSVKRIKEESVLEDTTEDEPEEQIEENVPIVEQVTDPLKNIVVPEGCTYTVCSTGKVYNAGEIVDEVAEGDIINDGEYVYGYGVCYVYNKDTKKFEKNDVLGGRQNWVPAVIDRTKTSYGAIRKDINGLEIKSLTGTFENCANMTVSPEIPSTVDDLVHTYNNCKSLTKAPVIPDNVTHMTATFMGCSSLKEFTAPLPSSLIAMDNIFRECINLVQGPSVIPENVMYAVNAFADCKNMLNTPEIKSMVLEDMRCMFSGCVKITSAPVIPKSVTDLLSVFNGCESLTTAPVIHENVTKMASAFSGCISLTGEITINAKELVDYDSCFWRTELPIVLKGSNSQLNGLVASSDNGNITVG